MSSSSTKKAAPSEDYLKDTMAANRFCNLIEDFMGRFEKNFETALRSKHPETFESAKNSSMSATKPSGKKLPGSTEKLVETVKKTAAADGGPVEVSTKQVSGGKYELVTVKNEKMQAGFLLPKSEAKAAPKGIFNIFVHFLTI